MVRSGRRRGDLCGAEQLLACRPPAHGCAGRGSLRVSSAGGRCAGCRHAVRTCTRNIGPLVTFRALRTVTEPLLSKPHLPFPCPFRLPTPQLGFVLEAQLHEGGGVGFDRPMYLLRKPAAAGAAGATGAGAAGTTGGTAGGQAGPSGCVQST